MDVPELLKRKRGRPPKWRPDRPEFKSAVEWSLAALNNPLFDLRMKAMIAASLLKYEAERDFGAGAPGKKERRAEAAEEAAVDAYAVPPIPTRPN